jgi:hypothetical protein
VSVPAVSLSANRHPLPLRKRIGNSSASARPRRRKAASGSEASEGQRACQGSTESGADLSEVSERASAGFGRRFEAQGQV